jgi:ubiquinone/menaquinone biosynthesis C-methylase UbiE
LSERRDGVAHYEAIADHYLKIAPERHGALYHDTRFRVFNSLLPKEPSRILDFGCGDGANIALMSDMGHSVVGIDPVQALLDQAAINAPKATYLRGSSERMLEFPAGAFNVIASLSTLSYLTPEQTDEFYSETKRLLAPGGCAVLSYSNALVDLTTFNRFTLAFYRDTIIPLLTHNADNQKTMLEGVRSRLAFPDEPQTKHSENDLVVRHRRNPFLIGDELAQHGFSIDDTRYMHWHPLPPQWLEQSAFKDLKYTERYPDWMGPLFASMFVVRCHVT